MQLMIIVMFIIYNKDKRKILTMVRPNRSIPPEHRPGPKRAPGRPSPDKYPGKSSK